MYKLTNKYIDNYIYIYTHIVIYRLRGLRRGHPVRLLLLRARPRPIYIGIHI